MEILKLIWKSVDLLLTFFGAVISTAVGAAYIVIAAIVIAIIVCWATGQGLAAAIQKGVNDSKG